MDFITGLPVSHGQDAIFTVVDRLTKMAHFIPTSSTVDATQTADLFLKEVFRLHGLPRTIISDRDPKFTSKFWQELMRLLQVKLKFSTAFHPQTDGQTEWTHRTIQDMLRNYVNHQQDDWVDYHPLVEFAYNNSFQQSIQMSPFYANSGEHPRTTLDLLGQAVRTTQVESTEEFAQRIKDVQGDIRRNMANAQIQQATHYNQKTAPDPGYKAGDQVLLSTQNISLATLKSGSIRKLAPKWIGPFKILQIISPVTFKLNLPPEFKIHPVFHAQLLKPYHQDSSNRESRPSPLIVNNQQEWEVQDILAERKRSGQKQYLVHWKGYTRHEATWEPMENLANATNILRRYIKGKQGAS
jgi:hypothetical protein